MKGYAIVAGTIAVVVVVIFFFTTSRTVQAPGEGYACTMDAKQCPDGSYVGRSGPSCEFEKCPDARTPVTVEAGIGQEIGSMGVTVIPLEVLEDSRCPIDVTCIQAGTVRIKARLLSGLGEAMQEFALNQEITTESETVTLTHVSPSTHSKKKIDASDYVFTFRITKRS